MVKSPSFSTFILKSSLVYVEGELHDGCETGEYYRWRRKKQMSEIKLCEATYIVHRSYSDIQSVPDLIINRLLKDKNGKSSFDESANDAV